MSDRKPNVESHMSDASQTEKAGIGKRRYTSPVLTQFGSVRELTGGNSLPNLDPGGTMAMQGSSDRALKENIVQVGDHPAGFGVYLFDYKPEFRDTCGHGRQFGVMADEVEGIVPEAVSIGSNGYRQVNYGLIGITRH
jgi:hypothetical protein